MILHDFTKWKDTWKKHNTYQGARKNQDRSRSSQKKNWIVALLNSWLSRVNLCGSVSFAISFLSKVHGQRCSCDYICLDHRQWLAEELCAFALKISKSQEPSLDGEICPFSFPTISSPEVGWQVCTLTSYHVRWIHLCPRPCRWFKRLMSQAK